MNKIDLAKLGQKVLSKVSKHSPEILIGLGISGMAIAGVLAVKATPKAMQLIEEKKEEEGVEKLQVVDTVKTTWKCYAPAVGLGVVSAACIIGANSVSTRRTAALATAYKLSETALTEYKDAVLETIGEEKEREVKQKVAEKKVEKMGNVDINTLTVVGSSDIWFMDGGTGQSFLSNYNHIKEIENIFNNDLRTDDYLSWNYLLELFGLDKIDEGYYLGWNIDRDGYLRFDMSEVRKNKEGRPCVVIQYNNAPKYEFDY